MTRGSRLLLPLLVAVVFLAVYAVIDNNPTWLTRAHLEPPRIAKIVLFVASLPLILFLVRLLDLITFDVFASRQKHVRAPVLLREIVSIALFLILFAWALSTIFEYKVTAFLATGTVVAAVLGLALQETLGNVFAGIALHLEDSFEVGDVIRSGEFIGVVEAARWRGTRIRTFSNDIVIIPNSMLARERVEVFPRNNLNARVLQIGIDYNVPPATVISVLTQAAANIEGVSHDVPAFARVGGFGDSAVLYEIKYFMGDYSQRDRIDSEIRKAVWYALRRNSITIPYPIRSMQRYAPPAPNTHPDAEEILGRLAGVHMFAPLSRKVRESIAEAATVHVFSKGETILRHGAIGDSMFIVHEGAVSVRVGDEEVARITPGGFFGEMALLTGEHRAADVVALTDVVTIEIAKNALEPVLHEHPDLASSISASVAERRGSLDTVKTASPDDAHQSVLSRIRTYFGL